jgi:hypothetical protein
VLLPAVAAAPPPSAPTITSASSTAGNIYTPFTYQIETSSTATSFTAADLPQGLSIDTANGLIFGTPTVQGTFSVGLTATNQSGSGQESLTITIGAPLPVPVITSATAATGTVGSLLSYQITGTNSPTLYSAVGLPPGTSINTSTGLINGDPLSPGTWTATVKASNYSGGG